MTVSALDDALNSNKPSSFSLTTLRNKELQRLHQGRGNIGIGAPTPPSEIQKQFQLAYSTSYSQNRTPKSPSKGLPPLDPSVTQLPGADKATRTPEFLRQTPNLDDTRENMAGQSTLRSIERKYSPKPSNNGKNVTLTAENWQAVLTDLKAALDEKKSLQKDNKALTDENTKLTQENEQLTEDLEGYEEIKAKYEKMSAKKPRGKGKQGLISRKEEQNLDVVKAISSHIKDVLFRTHKFVLPGDELTKAAKLVWVAIKDNLKLDKGPSALTQDDFVEIYDSVILSELSARRQYCQTRCKLAADEWLETHKQLPTVAQIENVWEIPPPVDAPEDESEQAKKIRENSPQQKKHLAALEVLVWWLDSFLPHAVGLEYWGTEIRCFQFMTDKTVFMNDPSGKEKAYVTVTSEAFAHVLYANCRDKWQATHDYIKLEGSKNKGKGKKKINVPTYDKKNESTWVFQNKWSNSRTGQVVGGGWSSEAIDYFEDMKKKVLAFRKEEAEVKDFASYKLAQTLLCIANDIKLDDEEPANKKKRKPEQEAEEPVNKKVQIIYIDE